jgi:hypothetical protein
VWPMRFTFFEIELHKAIYLLSFGSPEINVKLGIPKMLCVLQEDICQYHLILVRILMAEIFKCSLCARHCVNL